LTLFAHFWPFSAIFYDFLATPLLPDPFSIENSAFSYENSPNSAEKARFSAEKDGNSLSFWREKANFEAARVKKCENEVFAYEKNGFFL
jgi:hypothetical protein